MRSKSKIGVATEEVGGSKGRETEKMGKTQSRNDTSKDESAETEWASTAVIVKSPGHDTLAIQVGTRMVERDDASSVGARMLR